MRPQYAKIGGSTWESSVRQKLMFICAVKILGGEPGASITWHS